MTQFKRNGLDYHDEKQDQPAPKWRLYRPDGSVFATFPTLADAKEALNILPHYTLKELPQGDQT